MDKFVRKNLDSRYKHCYGPAAGPMLRRIYKWSSWWNGAVITDICGLKLNEICHHQMRFIGSSTSKIRLRPGLRTPLRELTALPQTL